MSKKIFRIPLPPKNKILLDWIAGDWHEEELNLVALKLLLDHAQIVPKRKRRLIINGDFLDLAFLRIGDENFNRWIRRFDGIEEFFLPSIEASFAWGNDIIDKLQRVFREIIFIEGNHEYRLDRFIKSGCLPAYRHNFQIGRGLNFAKRGIKIHLKYGQWLDYGNNNLSITHGHYHGTTCLKKHFEECQNNVIFGHVHSYERKVFKSREDTKSAVSMPCMSNTDPEYFRGRADDWDMGHGLIKMGSDGTFNLSVHTTRKNRTILDDGRVLRG